LIADKLFNDWLACATADPDLISELTALRDTGDIDGIKDRFYRTLSFGTGGLRGVIGAGTNRMNIYTVRQAAQGLANYLKGSDEPQKVAIAYDSRIKSESFARQAALVLAANGIEAWLYPRLMPTPALSYAVRYLGCGAGVCITASHNPAAYNGYKVYGSDGGQITEDIASAIQAEIARINPFDSVCIDESYAEGNIYYIGEEVVDSYLQAVLAQRIGAGLNITPLNIVYTPLNGAGLECITRVFGMAGYGNATVVPEQEAPDGYFPTCPFPNPENKEAMQKGLELCKTLHADLLLATDPDCDRVGVAVCKSDDSENYQLLNGNEVGILLLDYICRQRIKCGIMPENPIAIKTIVTTALAEKIAAHYSVQLINVLTGFKYIGEQIGRLEKTGESRRFIFGFEESYGYLSGTYVRDKDAVNACLLICDMAVWYKQQDLSLADAITLLYKRFGYCVNGLESIDYPGAKGYEDMQAVMLNLREMPPAAICGYQVISTKDYLWQKSQTHGSLPSSDVLQFTMDDQTLLTIRPSGTEPKLKFYLSVTRDNKEDAERELVEYKEGFIKLLTSILEV